MRVRTNLCTFGDNMGRRYRKIGDLVDAFLRKHEIDSWCVTIEFTGDWDEARKTTANSLGFNHHGSMLTLRRMVGEYELLVVMVAVDTEKRALIAGGFH